MTTGVPLYLVTACSSPEEFVAAFRRYTDRTGLFVPSAVPLPAGKRGRIAVTLRDGGVMLEGEAEIVASSAKPSALYGRTGMTIRFVEPDEPSKTLLGELDRARIALKPVAPTVTARPSEVAAEPRPKAPAPGGRIDAANALAETVTIGDVAMLRDGGGAAAVAAMPALPSLGGPGESGKMAAAPPLKGAPKFVLPSIPAKSPTTKPPPIADPKPAALAPIVPAKLAAPPPKLEPKVDPPKPEPPPPAPAVEVKPEPPKPAKPAPALIVDDSAIPQVRSSVLETQPAAVVPPPKPAPPPPRPKPLFVVAEPEEKTDLTDLPEPGKRASVPEPVADAEDSAPSDAIPMPAPYETRKTSLGIAAVIVAPAAPSTPNPSPARGRMPKITEAPTPEGPRDTEVMNAEPGMVIGPPNVDAHAPTIQPGSLDVDILAATAGMDGDWTMTPDAAAPVPLVAPTPPAPPTAMTGDWIMSTDAEAEDGWSAPSKVNKRIATNHGVGPPMLEVASDEPLSSEPRPEPAPEDDGPKVQIDPTLIEALPDLERLAASSSGSLAPGPVSSPLIAPPPPPSEMMPAALPPEPMPPAQDPFAIDVDMGGMLPPPPLADAYAQGPQSTLSGVGMQPYLPPPLPHEMMMLQQQQQQQQDMMMMPPPAYGTIPPNGMMPPPPHEHLYTPDGMPPLGMMHPGEPPMRPTPPPLGGYTPLPGFAPPVVPNAGYGMMDPAQMIMPSPAQLATGDSTAVLHGGRRRILLIVIALVVVAGAIGIYLVTSTGGSRRTPEAGSGSAVAAGIAPADAGRIAHADPATDAGAELAADAAATTPPPAVADAALAAVPAPADAAAVAAGGPCHVHVITAPAGAEVLVDNAVVGKGPATIELPCDAETKLVFRKAPLITTYRVVAPKSGAADPTVRVVLAKQVFSLKVSSTPAGAAITINGKAAGVTPSNVKLNGFEPATIVMTKAGFESYTEKVTPKANAETVHGTLKRKK